MEFLFQNGKLLILILLLLASGAILFYLFGDRRRGRRLESYRDIPLQDDDVPHSKVDTNERSEDR